MYDEVSSMFLLKLKRAILICCGGFGDNGRMFQEYGAYFERRGVQVLSFTFPGWDGVYSCINSYCIASHIFFFITGKLHRASEMFLSSLLEYMDWVLASLLHCGIVIKLDKGKRQGKLPDIPPVTLFGHDFGCVVAFELIRLLKKSKTVYMPVHHFIASACRPPEVLPVFCGVYMSGRGVASWKFLSFVYIMLIPLGRLYPNSIATRRAGSTLLNPLILSWRDL